MAASTRSDLASPPGTGVLARLGIDGCVRLPIEIDAGALGDEIARLPEDVWGGADRDPVVLEAVDSFFVIGHPRGPRPRPAEDRPPLAELPLLRALLRERIPATPTRAIVARLRPGGLIPVHRDTARFFRDTIRLSFQIAADGPQELYCDGCTYRLRPGEVWALDNLRPHAVRNGGTGSRTNVLADYAPTEALVALVLAGDRALGAADEARWQETIRESRTRYRARRWQSLRYELSKWLVRRGWLPS